MPCDVVDQHSKAAVTEEAVALVIGDEAGKQFSNE